MRNYALQILIFLPLLQLYGQGTKPLVEGKVSYITPQNIYVKFEEAGKVQPGDTIFFRKDQVLVPLFVAESVSSYSCAGKLIKNVDLKISDAVFVKSKKSDKSDNVPISGVAPSAIIAAQADTTQLAKPADETGRIPKIRGRLSASSYSSFSNSSDFNQRMRYTFSMTADNISGSRISTDTYIMFTHKADQWPEIQENIFTALKIYSLSVKYDVTDQTRFWLGRKINSRISGIGAIDGLQGETTVKNFTFGAVAGFSPDYADYSLNTKLFEYGGYISHDYNTGTGHLLNSIGYFQQTNNGNIDRRFTYFQHENSLVKNLNLFLSGEIDLYALQNGIPTDTISLTSLYLSLQYRFSKQFSVFGSYDTRKNVIYYETFKNYLDQMLEDATRKGYQLRINYRPTNNISSGISGGYRFRKNDLEPMYNVNGFLSFNEVPWIKASVSLSTNWLQTSYVDGMIYGIRVSRDIVPSKLNCGVFYRLVDNNYLNSNSSSLQHMAQLEFSWQISRKLSLSCSYDGTFEDSNKYNSIYINLIKRF